MLGQSAGGVTVRNRGLLSSSGKSRKQGFSSTDLQQRFSRTDQLLISAARDGDTSLVLELLDCTHTININARDRKSGSTALVVGSAWGHAKIVSILLDKGADPTLHNFEGRSALEIAATTEITLLLLTCLQKSSSPSTLLQQSSWQGNVALLEQVLSNGENVDLEGCNNEGLSPLLLASRDIKVFQALSQQSFLNNYNPAEVVTHLLNAGSNIQHQDQQGRTALHYCVTTVTEAAFNITNILLQHNANPNSVDKHSFTPLHFAVKSKSLEATKILISSGADVNKQTYAGHTALHIAASHGDVKLAATLLENGAGVTAVTHSGLSPLKCAANREMYMLLKAAIGASAVESSAIDYSLYHNERNPSGSEEQSKDEKISRKSKSSRRHKSTTNVKKQQLLFTMHLGLAVTKSPTTSANDDSKICSQSQESSSKSIPTRSSPSSGLPSKIPIVAKFGSGDFRSPRQSSKLRSRSCTNCDILTPLPVDELDETKEADEEEENVHSDSSSDCKSSTIPDVLKSSSNLPLFGKSSRKHRRYPPPPGGGVSSGHELELNSRSFLPCKNQKSSIHRYHQTNAPDKELQNLYVFLGENSRGKCENMTVADYQKIGKHYIPSYNEPSTRNKPSVHFIVDPKQIKQQRHRYPYSVNVRGKRNNKTKAVKSDSEVETTKSISPVKGQAVSLYPSANKSKIVSRLPRMCRGGDSSYASSGTPHRDQQHHERIEKYEAASNKMQIRPSLNNVVEQFRAITLQGTPSESNCTLDTSISSDCVSQVSAASWIYFPNDDTHCNYTKPTGYSGNCISHSASDIRGKPFFWQDKKEENVAISNLETCEDDILIEDESPEHLYDCPLTPPPSLNFAKKRVYPDISKRSKNTSDTCTIDSESSDAFQWSSDSFPTPVCNITNTVPSLGTLTKCLKNAEDCLSLNYEQMSIPWAKGKLLGKGSFGMVWCGMTTTGDLIAVKQVKLNGKEPQHSADEYLQIQQEFQMLQRLQHRNIVSYLGTQLEGSTVSIFMQYLAGGSLAHNLSQFGQFAESVICRYSKQILDGIEYLHGKGIVHRDIKGANIMVMPSEVGGLIKLIDFGCAKRLHMSLQDSDHYIQSVRGTPYWMAPEVIQQAGCTEKSDIWSVGCTIIEMATTKPPWHELPPFSAAYAIGQGTSKAKIPGHLSPVARDFIESTMRRNPDARPLAGVLLQHTFLIQITAQGKT